MSATAAAQRQAGRGPRSGLRSRTRIALLVGLAWTTTACGPPPFVTGRPMTPPSISADTLLPDGPRSRVTFADAVDGLEARGEGTRMAAFRYASDAGALAALRDHGRAQEQRPDVRHRVLRTAGTAGSLVYAGDALSGVAWTSGPWLFVAEAPDGVRLAAVVEASGAGGHGRASAVARRFPWLVAGAVVLGVAGTFALTTAAARWAAVTPVPGTAPVPADELRRRLLALNDPGRPFTVGEDPRSDLAVEWKIVDAAWRGALHRAGLREAYRLRLALDARRHEVRVLEDLGTVEWLAGTDGPTPRAHYARRFFRGIVLFRHERGRAWAMRSLAPPAVGTVFDYRFDVRDVKDPVIATVVDAGWRFQPVLWPWQVARQRRA